MSAIANTMFSLETAAKFERLEGLYPLKRSALVPMLLYAQDEVGFVSDAVVACMLRGGYEILDHCRAKLGIGHKGTTADGLISLEEVECIGACCWAPAMQVNYDFHDVLTPDKVDVVFQMYRDGLGRDVK